MNIIKDINELEQLLNGQDVYLTIGNFDGVHLGHQDFLNSIKDEAKQANSKFLVITFIPHPGFVLRAKPHFLLNTYEERRHLLKDLGVDYLLELDFTRDFSTLTPESFLNQFVFTCKNIKRIYLGYDFHFGANKAGNFELAKKEAEKRGIQLFLHTEFKCDSKAVSSSLIRQSILDGQVDKAAELLGRNYFMSGRVIKGMGRGRQIGFPTANLGYDKDVIQPSKGVYITKTELNGMVYESITNVGVNPTFNTGYEVHVETNLFGFSRDIYGEEIKVFFIEKLREEQKFSSVNELVKQIEIDVEKAKKYFKK